jgi:hypothetical protein
MSETILVRLADGSLVNKHPEDLQPDDRIVIDGPDAYSDLDAARQRLDDAIEAAGGLETWRASAAQQH